MKTLLFLFILDFSGSMYQKIEGKEKYLILRENISAMMNSMETDVKDSSSGLLIFGLHPKNKCEDFEYSEVRTSKVENQVNSYLPGAYSMTPLAASLDKGTDLTIQKKIKKLVIFSDGADSCGQDPCKQLEKSNDKLKAANYKMSIKFIGINLKKNDPKFACFRNPKFSNINIDYSNIGESYDVQEALRKGNEITLDKVKAPYGVIQVKGAPVSVQFRAIPQQAGVKDPGRLTWQGSFRNRLKAGNYWIEVKYPGAKKKSTTINAAAEEQLYWSDFFNDPTAQVSYSKSTFTYVIKPSEQTKNAHREIRPYLVEGQFRADPETKILKLPFGQWSIEVVSPPWIKAESEKKSIAVDLHAKVNIDFVELFNLELVQVPDARARWVFELTRKQEVLDSMSKNETNDVSTNVERYYLENGVQSIFIPKGAKIRWVQTDLKPGE